MFPASVDAAADPPARNPAKLALVVGGALIFIAVGVWLAILCFSDASTEPSQVEKDDGIPDSSTSPKPAVVRPRPPSPEENPLVVLPKAEQEKADRALQRGLAYLKKSQQVNGTWPPAARVGHTALPALALLECGVPRNDPIIQNAAQYLRADRTWKDLNTVYDIALIILFLDRLDEAGDRERIRTLALRLIAGQTATGGWGYKCPILGSPEESQLGDVLKSYASTVAAKLQTSPFDVLQGDYSKLGPGGPAVLIPRVKNLPVLQEPRKARNGKLAGAPGDNSNTQFALLALWAARRHDVPLERTLGWVMTRFRTSQQRSGNWGYRYPIAKQPNPRSQAMTCAGLLGLALGLGLTNDARIKGGKQAQNAAKDPGVARAIKFLSGHIGDPKKNGAKDKKMDVYFLWSIERVAVIFQLPDIGGKDWYGWGARAIIAHQAADGSLAYHGSRPVGTSLALLFLKRANLARGLEKLMLGD